MYACSTTIVRDRRRSRRYAGGVTARDHRLRTRATDGDGCRQYQFRAGTMARRVCVPYFRFPRPRGPVAIVSPAARLFPAAASAVARRAHNRGDGKLLRKSVDSYKYIVLTPMQTLMLELLQSISLAPPNDFVISYTFILYFNKYNFLVFKTFPLENRGGNLLREIF